MLLSALLVALFCAGTSALTPLSAAADDNDCALYLAGPARTSAYDYSLNLLRGNFGYEGQHTCITYDAVNQAYLEARKRILVSQPKGDWKPEDYASVGELILDISINIARIYGLTYEEIEKALPLIDTSRTLIREVCPPVFSHVECRAGKYRRLDGLCNNLQHPTWGSTNVPFQRLIGPLYADGINAPRISHTGRDLPLSRVVSRTMHPDEGFHDHAGTVMVIAWGQFMDHDYTLTATPLDPRNRNDPEECCKRPPHLKHPYCNEIRIPDDDYFYRLFGVKCIDFVRAFPSPRPGCRLGSRAPFNTLTGVIDGNTVYGVTDKFARKLRTGYGGLLRMNPVFDEYGLKDLLPLKLDIPDEGCTRPNKNMYCFEAGEIRVNEQLVLTVMHTLMAREHNRVAKGLAAVNPHWDDETLYQEARRINIAEIQHITYNEFLPILLGKDVMEKFGLVLEKEGFWDGYDPNVNPDVIASFAAAAYRFGHSLLPTAVERWSKAHKFIASKRLSDLIRRPYDLYRAGVLDEYVMGLMNQVAQAMDDSITQEVTNHLFKKIGARFGMDLVSFNMQRGREFGVPGYMEFRKFCGLPGADSFQDLFGSMPNETVRKYESIFEHPIDVDLWSGGVSERPLPGSMLGPTFACIIATQFSYSRRGDRFWFELPNQPSSFTPEQLKEVRKSRLARIICDNTDIIDTTQLYPFVLPDHELNPRVPCRSGIIPSMDFSKWAEPAPFHSAGPTKQFITEAVMSVTNETYKEIKVENSTAKNKITSEIKSSSTNYESQDVKPCLDFKDSQNNSSNTLEAICDSAVLNQAHTNATNSTNSDIILKYVYKNNEKELDPVKTQGHPKNSLKRRKRTVNETYNTNSAEPRSARIIVDYETNHRLSPHQDTGHFVKNSKLADFAIETRHLNPHSHTQNNVKTKPVDDSRETNSEDQEDLAENSFDNRKQSKDSNETNESIDVENLQHHSDDGKNLDSFGNRNFKAKQSSEFLEHIGENKSSKKYKNEDYPTNNDSRENAGIKESPTKTSSEENSQESGEENKYERPLLQESIVNEDSEKNLQQSSEENFESFEAKPQNIYKEDIQKEQLDSPSKVQDTDLNESSYEHFKDGRTEDVEKTRDENNSESDEKSITMLNDRDKESIEIPHSQEVIEYDKKPKNLNDGEIKPVIEIQNESSSIESSGESNKSEDSHESYQEKKDGSEELESAEIDTKPHSNEKIIIDNQDKKNVKQDFERIPINYQHDKKEQHLNEQVENHSENQNNDGTLDTLSPKQGNYDENLNIKFDKDITIQLPEIKLPEDILAYAYDESLYKKQNPSFTSKENDDDDDGNEDENETNYPYENYYGKSNYYSEKDNLKNKKNNDDEDDDDNVDLYEKFVKERFGKRGSFEKRSEKLRSSKPHLEDPKLYDAIQNILKKTQQTHKEAAKSGDPNAGYMWTLEYGEKL